MRPKRYPYSGYKKTSTDFSMDITINESAVRQSVNSLKVPKVISI